MLSESSETFPEPPIMSAPLFSIPTFPICNSGPVHPQARIGLGSAPGITSLIPLAVHLTRSRIGTLENLPYHSRTCSGMSFVTLAATRPHQASPCANGPSSNAFSLLFVSLARLLPSQQRLHDPSPSHDKPTLPAPVHRRINPNPYFLPRLPFPMQAPHQLPFSPM